MSIPCPRCGRQFDVTLFDFGRTVACPCGELLDASHVALLRFAEGIASRAEDRAGAEELGRMADEVCGMIIDGRLGDAEIDIAIERARERCRELFPGKEDLFEMVYGSRFRRLREQFRPEGG